MRRTTSRYSLLKSASHLKPLAVGHGMWSVQAAMKTIGMGFGTRIRVMVCESCLLSLSAMHNSTASVCLILITFGDSAHWWPAAAIAPILNLCGLLEQCEPTGYCCCMSIPNAYALVVYYTMYYQSKHKCLMLSHGVWSRVTWVRNSACTLKHFFDWQI